MKQKIYKSKVIYYNDSPYERGIEITICDGTSMNNLVWYKDKETIFINSILIHSNIKQAVTKRFVEKLFKLANDFVKEELEVKKEKDILN